MEHITIVTPTTVEPVTLVSIDVSTFTLTLREVTQNGPGFLVHTYAMGFDVTDDNDQDDRRDGVTLFPIADTVHGPGFVLDVTTGRAPASVHEFLRGHASRIAQATALMLGGGPV